MHFTITHPMHSHPYNPELVSGDGIGKVAAAAEAAGIHGFGFTDHPAPSQRWLEAGGHDAVDPFVALGFAAATTTTLRLIPNIVVLPYRNPFVVAKSGATLDLLSGGRFTLAVGVGYLKREFAALGVSYDERAELFEEALQVIRAIWTGDDISFEGKHFSARGITAHPRPVSDPHPPIWIGGNTTGVAPAGSAVRRRLVPVPRPAPTGSDGWHRGHRLGAKTSPTASTICGADAMRRAETGRPSTSPSPTSKAAAPDDDFNADAYLDGLEKLAKLGVTWVSVHLPGDSMAHALETLDRFRTLVIDAA